MLSFETVNTPNISINQREVTLPIKKILHSNANSPRAIDFQAYERREGDWEESG